MKWEPGLEKELKGVLTEELRDWKEITIKDHSDPALEGLLEADQSCRVPF